MNYRTIQTIRGDIQVSNLVMGSAVSMGNLPEEEVFAIFDTYVSAGGNIFDTARAYWDGAIEKRIGNYLKAREGSDKIMISTKGGHPGEDGLPRLSKEELMLDLEASLKNLGRDYIEIYWIHKDDESVPVEQIVDAANELLATGKIGTIGVSNWHTQRIAEANEYAEKNGLQGFKLSQIQWSLAATEDKHFAQFGSLVMNEKDYNWYYEHGIKIFSFSSQAQGFFAIAANKGIDNLEGFLKEAYDTPANRERLARVIKLAEENNTTVAAPVLSYLIHNKLTCFPIFGALTPEMAKESLACSELEMSEAESDSLFLV